MKLKYILPTEQDHLFLIQVRHTVYNDITEEMFNCDEERQGKLGKGHFNNGSIYIVWNGNNQIGFIAWEERGNYLLLKHFFILPEYQKQDIGSQIVKDIIRKARSLAKDIHFKILKANTSVKKIYELHGFEVIEESDIYWNMILKFTVPTLKTKRLLLKPITLRDASAYQRYFAHYEIIRNFCFVPWPYPKDGVKHFLNNLVFPYQGDMQWLWGLFLCENPDELIGAVHLWREPDPDNRGLWLSRKHQGKGLMTEALKPVMDYAFNDLGFEKLVFSNAVGNEKSRRIKEKTGARSIKVVPMKFVDPKFTEIEIWELKAEEWLQNTGDHRPTA